MFSWSPWSQIPVTPIKARCLSLKNTNTSQLKLDKRILKCQPICNRVAHTTYSTYMKLINLLKLERIYEFMYLEYLNILGAFDKISLKTEISTEIGLPLNTLPQQRCSSITSATLNTPQLRFKHLPTMSHFKQIPHTLAFIVQLLLLNPAIARQDFHTKAHTGMHCDTWIL